MIQVALLTTATLLLRGSCGARVWRQTWRWLTLRRTCNWWSRWFWCRSFRKLTIAESIWSRRSAAFQLGALPLQPYNSKINSYRNRYILKFRKLAAMSFQSNAEPESPSLASVLYFLQKEHANFDRERGRYGFYLPLSNMFSTKDLFIFIHLLRPTCVCTIVQCCLRAASSLKTPPLVFTFTFSSIVFMISVCQCCSYIYIYK